MELVFIVALNCCSGTRFLPIWIVGGQLMRRVWRMHLSFFMKQVNVSGQDYGLVIASFTTTPPGGLITVSVVMYGSLILTKYISMGICRFRLKPHI